MAEKDDTAPSASPSVAVDLIDTAFTKIKELGAEGDLELDVQAGPDVRLSLKIGAGSARGVSKPEDDAEVSFNAEGHHTIALIAMADLTSNAPATGKAVNDLLDSVNRDLEKAATFPDDIRNSQPKTKPFHFIDIPFEDGGPVNPPLPDPPHVISKLAEFTQFLINGGGTDQEKVDALSWVIHLMGDVHQPLHCIEHITEDHPGGDRGGNSFLLKGKAKNLHSLWDSSVDFSNVDQDALVSSIMSEHTREALKTDLQQTDVEEWARSGYGLAKRFAYNIEENPENPPKPSAAYLKKANQIGRRQAALAGYRLADRLQTIFR